MTRWSVPWRRAAVSALLIGMVGAALTACASPEQRAEEEAVEKMKNELSDLEASAKSFLRTSPDRDSVRRDFAREQGPNVYASSIHGDAITWSIAVVGQGGSSSSLTSTVIHLRACLQMRSAAALELSLTTVSCPATFTKSPNFDSSNHEIDLLKKFSASERPAAACPTVAGQQAPPGCAPYDGEAAMRANEAYRQRFALAEAMKAKAGKHLTRITVALQSAVKSGPLDRTGVARVLGPLGYVESEVQAYGRSDGPGGMAIGVGTDAGCVFGGIRGKAVDLKTGGIIADGGCLEAKGH